jgi:hypothetical protein
MLGAPEHLVRIHATVAFGQGSEESQYNVVLIQGLIYLRVRGKHARKIERREFYFAREAVAAIKDLCRDDYAQNSQSATDGALGLSLRAFVRDLFSSRAGREPEREVPFGDAVAFCFHRKVSVVDC